MSKRCYYEVLTVERSADDRTIKKAYHKLAMEFHPDRNDTPEGEEKFKEASEAYEVLSDTKKRKLYDTHGFDGLRNSGFSGFEGVGVDEIFSSFGDIFGDLFGFGRRGGGGRARNARGADLQVEIVLDFEEAAFGCTQQVQVEHHSLCKSCEGTGAKAGTSPKACQTCQGRGQVMHGQGMFLISTTCPDCRGQGSIIESPCVECKGQGRVPNQRELQIKVPAGFDDGQRLRYAGEGEPGARGAPPGDLYILVRVRPHASLRREGDDLIAELPLSIADAALGTTLTIDGLDGPEDVRVAKGTQPNEIISLRRKGVPRLRGNGRGDLHIICVVHVPKKLSTKEKNLLEEFREVSKAKDLKAEGKKGGKKKRKGLFS